MLCKAFIRHLIQHLLIPFKSKRSCEPHGGAVHRGGIQPQQNHTEDEGGKNFLRGFKIPSDSHPTPHNPE